MIVEKNFMKSMNLKKNVSRRIYMTDDPYVICFPVREKRFQTRGAVLQDSIS
jgi:hypothetical protein